MNQAELTAVADTLRRLLGAVEAGELTASAAMTYRLQGALIVIEALIGGRGINPGAFSDEPASP